jgi:hypothetical protein
MGWLDRKQRRRVRKKFRIRSFYFCDAGNHPIPVGGLIVIDPQKGYFPWPHNMLPGVKQLTAREPKWCSCYECDRKRRETLKHKKGHKQRVFLETMDHVFEMIKHKPKRGYWTIEKVCSKLRKKYDSRSVIRAVKQLRKQGELKKREGCYLVKG